MSKGSPLVPTLIAILLIGCCLGFGLYLNSRGENEQLRVQQAQMVGQSPQRPPVVPMAPPQPEFATPPPPPVRIPNLPRTPVPTAQAIPPQSPYQDSAADVSQFLRALASMEQQRRQVKQQCATVMARVNRALVESPMKSVMRWDDPRFPTSGKGEEGQLADIATNTVQATLQRLQSLRAMLRNDPAGPECSRLRAGYDSVLQADVALYQMNLQDCRLLSDALQNPDNAQRNLAALKQQGPLEQQAGQNVVFAVRAANQEMAALRNTFPAVSDFFTVNP